jgi:hypothetical protein
LCSSVSFLIWSESGYFSDSRSDTCLDRSDAVFSTLLNWSFRNSISVYCFSLVFAKASQRLSTSVSISCVNVSICFLFASNFSLSFSSCSLAFARSASHCVNALDLFLISSLASWIDSRYCSACSRATSAFEFIWAISRLSSSIVWSWFWIWEVNCLVSCCNSMPESILKREKSRWVSLRADLSSVLS